MLRRKLQHREIVKNVKRVPKAKIKANGYTPDVRRRHPFSGGNRNR